MSPETKSTLLGLSPLSSLVSGTIPGLNIIVPLVLWLVWKDENPQLAQIGKNILNSQISWTIWIIIATAISLVLVLILIGVVLIYVAPILWLIFTIINAVKVCNGETNYVMPMTITFLK